MVCLVNLEEKVEFIIFFKIYQGKIARVTRIGYILPPKQTQRPLPLLLSPSFLYASILEKRDTLRP